ncbi:hypothetical protein GCM10017602_23700 [Herbiconiux flava]|nr:hypothetical protein GCM10017602_23700 [Herbiconiux flava]
MRRLRPPVVGASSAPVVSFVVARTLIVYRPIVVIARAGSRLAPGIRNRPREET